MVKSNKLDIQNTKKQNEIVNIIEFLLEGKGTVSSLHELISSIRVSLGTKKKLDALNKNKLSYDNLITDLIDKNNYLLEEMGLLKQELNKNKIQNISLKLNEYARKNEILRYGDYMIIYSYNKYIGELDNFEFYLKIDKIKYKGEEFNKKEFYQFICISLRYSEKLNSDKLIEIVGEMVIYFTLLTELIQKNFNKNFKVSTEHGLEPKYWEYILGKIKLPERVLNEDVISKVEYYQLSIEQIKRNMAKMH